MGILMNWITDQIAIDNYLDAQNATLLQDEGILSILGLTDTLKDVDSEDLGVEDIEVIALNDGPGNHPQHFIRAVETLADFVKYSPPVLVHCHAGRSRSVIVVEGYFMKELGISPQEAIRKISSKREIALSKGIIDMLAWS